MIWLHRDIRLLAAATLVLLALNAAAIWQRRGRHPEFVWPAWTLQVATGAIVLTTSLVITLRASRVRLERSAGAL